MKNYLKSAFAIFFMFAVSELHGQIESSYVFGLNLSTMTVKTKGISYDAETPTGFHFGKTFEIPVSRNFALQPILLFSAKGSDYKIDTSDISISPIYFEIPVNAVCRFGSSGIRVSLFAGPYFACGVGGYKIVSGGELKDIRYGSGLNHDLKLFDAGFNLGAGINISGFMISVQYEIGLKNISPVTTFDSEMKNQVLGISISMGGNSLNFR
jgi:hypothetical protein